MKILIVDDIKFNLIHAKEILLENEIKEEILLCSSGQEALEIIKNGEIDLVLLDIVMPKIDGIDVLKKIREEESWRDIQIIMVTSLEDKEVLKSCFDIGANDFVNKPIDPVEFISRIKRSIQTIKNQNKIKRMLNAVNNKNDQLEKMTKKLKETQDYLIRKEKLSAIGQLSGGIAHEFNNPLAHISINFEALEQHVLKLKQVINRYENFVRTLEKENLEEKIFDEIENINLIKKDVDIDVLIEDVNDLMQDSREELNRVSNIVHSLKSFAKTSEEEEFIHCDFNEIIVESLLILKNEARDVANIVEELKEIPILYCNQNEIWHALLNIILNGIQAIKSQNRKEKGKIIIRTYSEQNYIFCEVEDDGPGIEENIIEKIFDPFFTTKSTGEESGLGLSTSYDTIVNKHKGDLFMKSHLGKGSIFTIKLPIGISKEVE